MLRLILSNGVVNVSFIYAIEEQDHRQDYDIRASIERKRTAVNERERISKISTLINRNQILKKY